MKARARRLGSVAAVATASVQLVAGSAQAETPEGPALTLVGPGDQHWTTIQWPHRLLRHVPGRPGVLTF